MTGLISVIVPVYKVEAYLDKCIKSIIDQTYQSLEIILVDDGSPDRSGEICDSWAEIDCRIKVIHKKNGGGGEARNIALDIAEGDFISLIDSDDYIAPNMYEHLMGLMGEDVDIVECDLIETEGDNALLEDGKGCDSELYTVQEAMSLHINDTLFRQTPPNKLYRRNVIGDIRFPVGKRIDDEFWTYRVIANARKLVHTFCSMYAYRQHPSSVMHLSFSMARLQAIDAKCQRIEFLYKKFPELTSQARINLWYTCLYMGQMALKCLEVKEQKKVFEKIDACLKQYPLTSSDCRGLRIVQRVWVIFSKISYPATCVLRNIMKIGI